MLKVVLIVAAVFAGNCVWSQKNEVVIEYINTYKQLAVDEMLRTGVPAAIKLAQGIHETQAGQSDLVTRSNNHFGIKCKTGWQGDKVYHDDDERGECFRSYSSANDSYMDHSNFLKNSQRYSILFQLDPADYKGWAYGLKKAGYATNIKYSQILIKLIEEYNLQVYSLVAMGKATAEETQMAGVSIRKPGEQSKTTAVAVAETPIPAPVVPAIVYPTGEFTINKARVLFVKAGTSLLTIAKLYDISLSRIFDFNDLGKEDVLVEDQLIFLQRKRKVGATDFHTVQQGETVYSISQAEGIRLESLLEYNQLQPGMVPAVGEKLSLQKRTGVAPKLVEETVQQKTVADITSQVTEEVTAVHKVQPKETLYGIARTYGTTAEKIMEWNKLQGTQLKKGQELIIYKN